MHTTNPKEPTSSNNFIKIHPQDHNNLSMLDVRQTDRQSNKSQHFFALIDKSFCVKIKFYILRKCL